MPVEHDVETVAPRRVRQRSRDELHQIDVVAGERPERAEQGAGPVVGDERQRRAPAFAAAHLRIRRERDEAGEGSRTVADVVQQNLEPVRRSGFSARDRHLSRIAGFGDIASRVGGRRGGDAPNVARTEQVTALIEAQPGARARSCASSRLEPGKPTTQWRIGNVASRMIERGARKSRSCVSAIGPTSELSIGRTPSVTSAAAAASTTATKLGRSTDRTASGTSTDAAASL